MKFISGLLFFLVCVIDSLSAYNIRQVTNADGLTSSAVLSLLQDSNGFVWMGTCDGVNIYDGIKAYSWNGWGQLNLSGYIIEEILETHDGVIWVQTNYGLSKVDKDKRLVVDYPQFKGSYMMVKNELGDLFFFSSSNSLYAFNEKKQEFYKIPIRSLNREEIVNLYVNEHFLVIFLKNEIVYYQIDRSQDGEYKLSSVNTCEKTQVNYGFGDKDQIYWLDGDYNLFGYSLDKPVKKLICNWKEALDGRGTIVDILRDGSSFFIAFQTNGLLKVSLQSDNKYTVDDLGIKSGVFRILKDRFQDIVWIATDGQGVYIYSEGQYSIASVTYEDLNHSIGKPVRSIFWDDEGTLWLGTKGEGILKIYDFSPQKHNIQYRTELINSLNDGLVNNSVYAFAKSSRPLFWIGHDAGISYYSYRDRKIRSVHSPEPINYVHAIYEESDSVLWIATVGTGVIRARMEDRAGVPYIRSLKRYTIDHGNFSSNYFFTLFADEHNNIWFGNRGYGLFHINGDSLVNVPLKKKYSSRVVDDIFSITRNEKGLWLGTGAGLIKKMQDEETCFNQQTGFINSTVHTMLQDENQRLWIATNGGLISFDILTNKFQNYGKGSGLKIQEFSDGAAFSRNNTLFFGGINGFVAITNDAMYTPGKEVAMPPLRFTNVYILGEEGRHAGVQSWEDKPSLSLKSDENTFTISFLALDYVNPTNYSYQYRLDKNMAWVDNGTNNSISFTQMRYGNYLLEIRYKNQATGEFSPIYSVYITIAAPWYLSTLAVVVYALLILLAVLLCIRWFLLKQQRKRLFALEKMEQQHKEELYEEKLRFFTNITHEFSTPLTLIYGPCERLLEYDHSEYVHKYVTMIKANAERLNALIQEIIDFRRLETGHQVLCIQQVDVSALCNDIIHSFSELAERNKIQVENVVSENIVWNTDRRSLMKILNNLISNAFKYTSVGGRIRVTVDIADNQKLRIKVYNTGKGIRQEDIPLVFNRYKVLDGVEASNIKGMTSRNGLGLAICHSMVELLKGEIQIQSEYGSYAEFIVLLPMLDLTLDKKENDSSVSDVTSPVNVAPQVSVDALNNAGTDTDTAENKILVVDDNTEMLALLQESFSKDFNVIVAQNAEQALEMVKNETPSLIITDVMMPGMDGFELTRQLKQNKYTMSIPVIILSAKNASQEQITGFDAGADAYIGKPFDIDYLKAIVVRLIENRNKLKDYFNSSACAYDFSHGHLVKAEDKEFLLKVTEYIESHVDSEELSLEELAEYMQVSVRTLYRRFKEIGLDSPKDYIKEYRINLAAKLLRTTSLTVQEIIYKTGFMNRSHFYKEFSKHFQMTPKDYRNTYKKKEDDLK